MDTKLFLETSETKKKAIGLIHRVYITQLKNARKHTASTKTKSEVRGGGRKPWKQKGTGRARAGSSRSPLWTGGGVSFGPKPHLVSKKINKKERRLAIISALHLKKKQFVFFDETTSFKSFDKVKTKNTLGLLKTLGLTSTSKILFILTKSDAVFYKNFWLASRNIKNIEITTAETLNLRQLLNANHIVLANTTLDSIYLHYENRK